MQLGSIILYTKQPGWTEHCPGEAGVSFQEVVPASGETTETQEMSESGGANEDQ